MIYFTKFPKLTNMTITSLQKLRHLFIIAVNATDILLVILSYYSKLYFKLVSLCKRLLE